MKLPKNAKIENCVSDEPTRAVLNHVYIDRRDDGSTFAVATDGRMLALIPVEFEEGDAPGLVPIQALIEARRQQKKMPGDTVTINANGDVKLPSGMAFERPQLEYPNYRQVIPNDEVKFRIAFDAERLFELSKALGGKNHFVTIECTDDKSPLRVQSCDGKHLGLGVLMTVRLQ